MKPLIDLVGESYGRLTVLERVLPNYNGHARWLSRCDCGATTVIVGAQLRSGNTASCGCLGRERRRLANTKHNKAGTRIYWVWQSLIDRCRNQNHKNFARYGGRGIAVCERWLDFANFYADMGDAPKGMTLDRKDNDGPYSPGNCRWATWKEQRLNSSSLIHWVDVEGQKMPLADACRALGVSLSAAYSRVSRGVPAQEAITQ